MASRKQGQGNETRCAHRARLLRDGHSWRSACILSGYSLSAANRGPKGYFEGSPGVRREFARLLEEEAYSPDQTRKIAKNRLTNSVVEGKPSNVAREIELLGRFKEHDWWVKPSEVQLGIFAYLCDPEARQRISAQVKAMDDYADEDNAPTHQTKQQEEKIPK